MTPPPATIHASCVAIDGAGVLILGASGAGKSDLALRLIDRGARLVGDDRCIVRTDDRGSVVAAPPAAIAGKIEVRGIGIVAHEYLASAPVALVVQLDDDPPRMPDPNDSTEIAGRRLPRLRIDPHEASAPIKVELALRATTA